MRFGGPWTSCGISWVCALAACSSPVTLPTSSASSGSTGSAGSIGTGATGTLTGGGSIGGMGGGSTTAAGTGSTGRGCVGSQTDPTNCGACGNVCPTDATCVAGLCTGQNGQPSQCPTTAPAGPGCPDGLTCVEGSCETATCEGAADGTSCVRGVLEVALLGTCCGGRCADLAADPDNCAACGNTCASGLCKSGEATGGYTGCFPPADAGPACGANDTSYRACGLDAGVGVCCATGYDAGTILYACANLLDDPHNCGGCGLVCDAGVACSGGVCGSPAALVCGAELGDFCDLDAGFTDVCCASGCGPLGADQNCGTCGHDCTVDGQVCAAAPLCAFASCAGTDAGAVCALDGGLGSCCDGTGCVDLTRDPHNCGACAADCADAGGLCLAGSCLAIVCTDAGAAQNAPCAVPTGGIGACCAPGRCANLLSDPLDCGACGIVCDAGCDLGACG